MLTISGNQKGARQKRQIRDNGSTETASPHLVSPLADMLTRQSRSGDYKGAGQIRQIHHNSPIKMIIPNLVKVRSKSKPTLQVELTLFL